MKISSNKLYYVFLILIVPIYFYLRLNLLDSNGPFFYHPSDYIGSTQIATMDEFFYMSKAIFWAKYNLYDSYQEYNLSTPFLFISNFFTYLSLKIVGLNFFGFRFPAVLSGFIIIFCFSKVIHNKFGFIASAFFIAYLIFDYHFTLANRTMNPNIFRLCVMGISVFVFYNFFEDININHKKIKIGIISFILSSVILFEYPSYIPIYIAWSFTILATLSKSLRELILILFILISVFILSYLLFILFLYYQNFYLDAVSRFINSHSSRNPFDFPNTKEIITHNIRRLKEALFVFSFGKANPIITENNLNLSFLFFLIPGFIFLIKVIFDYIVWLITKKNIFFSKTDFFVAVLLGGTFIQFILLNDYHIKKPFVILPLALYAVCYVLNQIEKIFNRLVYASQNTRRTTFVDFCLIFSITTFPYMYSTFPYMLNKTNKYIFEEAKFTHKNAMQYLSKYDGEYFSANAFDYALYNKILPINHHYLINYDYPLDKSSKNFKSLFFKNNLNLRIIYQATPYTIQLFNESEVNNSNEVKLNPISRYDKVKYFPDEMIMCSYEKRYLPIFIGSRKNKDLSNYGFKNKSKKSDIYNNQQYKNLKSKKNKYVLENYNDCKYNK